MFKYQAFISLSATTRSEGLEKLTNPYPLVLPVGLSLTTLAMLKEGNLENAFDKTSSFTSFPRLPQNSRKSFSGHSARVGSSQVCPAAFRGTAFFFTSAFCSISLLASAAFTFLIASGVIVCATL
uniref:Putative ovule protein n=2 Tax=Solanum chacoense TaxID=4108 RepID=A0A0V0HC48_SOLCH